MPYKFEKMVLKNQEDDARRKLTDEDYEHIKLLWNNGSGRSINQIAKDYGVAKRTIQFILFPERIQAARVNYNWRKYYSTEKRREYMKAYRERRKKLYKQGLLKNKEDK